MDCNVKDVFIDIAIERKTLMEKTVLEKNPTNIFSGL